MQRTKKIVTAQAVPVAEEFGFRGPDSGPGNALSFLVCEGVGWYLRTTTAEQLYRSTSFVRSAGRRFGLTKLRHRVILKRQRLPCLFRLARSQGRTEPNRNEPRNLSSLWAGKN